MLRRALALREAIHALFRRRPRPARGAGAGPRSRSTASSPPPWRRPAAPGGRRLRLGLGGDAEPQLDSVLRPLVRSAAELLLAPLCERVKQCPGHGCGWIFLDLTKNRNRRWCEMEICGSRNKVRRYHQRRRAAAENPF